MIQFQEDRYVSCFWHFHGVLFDWLAALWHDPGGPWNLQYRFSFELDDAIGDDCRDDKHWFEYVFPPGITEEDAREVALDMTAGVHAHVSKVQMRKGEPPCSPIECVEFGSSDLDENVAKLGEQSWCHFLPTQKGGSA